MQTDTAFYLSPIVTLFIKSISDTIEEVLFVNSEKGLKIDEGGIDLKAITSPVIQKRIHQLKEYFGGTRKLFDWSQCVSSSYAL